MKRSLFLFALAAGIALRASISLVATIIEGTARLIR